MSHTLILLITTIPGFAPAPVPRNSMSGELVAMTAKDGIITFTVEINGKRLDFKLADTATVTINGQKGNSVDEDVGEIRLNQKPRVGLILENGFARSVDVSLTFAEGATLWNPGMGPRTMADRRAKERARKTRAENARQR